MNQGSLSNYKQQVYNPGSPNPNPTLSPLKCLPRTPLDNSQYNIVTLDPENPLKLVIGSATKRKLSSDSDSSSNTETSPSKKLRMMTPEDVEKMNETLMNRFKQSQDEANKTLLSQITAKFDGYSAENKSLKTEMNTIATKLDVLTKKQDKAASEAIADKLAIDERFRNLEAKYESLSGMFQQTLSGNISNDSIQAAVKTYVDNSTESTWKANLAREVLEHEHGIVIHGYRLSGNSDQEKRESAVRFLKDELKASSDLINKIRIREVTRLGSDTGEGYWG